MAYDEADFDDPTLEDLDDYDEELDDLDDLGEDHRGEQRGDDLDEQAAIEDLEGDGDE